MAVGHVGCGGRAFLFLLYDLLIDTGPPLNRSATIFKVENTK